MNEVKYSYHHVQFRDYNGPHILTLARRVNGNAVTAGWSICYPGKWVPFEGYMPQLTREEDATELVHDTLMSGLETLKDGEKREWPHTPTLYSTRKRATKVKGYRLEKGDLFSKAKGRELALKRLDQSPVSLERKDKEHAIDAILRVLAASPHSEEPTLISRMAYRLSVDRTTQFWRRGLKQEAYTRVRITTEPAPAKQLSTFDMVKSWFGIQP